MVLLTEADDLDRSQLQAQARREGLAEIHVPRVIIAVRSVPLLGSGKVDYAAARELVERYVPRASDEPS